MAPPRPVRTTAALAVVTVIAYVITRLTGDQMLALQGGFLPARFTTNIVIPSALPAWLTPLSATLLHGGILHLCFNILMLVYCGRQVESVLGGVRLVILYIAGAYGAALAQFLVYPASTVPMIGASGAISALIAAYALMYSRSEVSGVGPILGPVLRALWLAVAWVGMQTILAIVTEDGPFAIATAAHVGGFLIGLALTYPLLEWRYRSA